MYIDQKASFAFECLRVQKICGRCRQSGLTCYSMSTDVDVRRIQSISSVFLSELFWIILFSLYSEEETNPGLLVDEESEDGASGIEISDMTEYKHVFRPRHELSKNLQLIVFRFPLFYSIG